jgi:hypothetical protein
LAHGASVVGGCQHGASGIPGDTQRFPGPLVGLEHLLDVGLAGTRGGLPKARNGVKETTTPRTPPQRGAYRDLEDAHAAVGAGDSENVEGPPEAGRKGDIADGVGKTKLVRQQQRPPPKLRQLKIKRTSAAGEGAQRGEQGTGGEGTNSWHELGVDEFPDLQVAHGAAGRRAARRRRRPVRDGAADREQRRVCPRLGPAERGAAALAVHAKVRGLRPDAEIHAVGRLVNAHGTFLGAHSLRRTHPGTHR